MISKITDLLWCIRRNKARASTATRWETTYSYASDGKLNALRTCKKNCTLKPHAAAYGAVDGMQLHVVDWLLETFSDPVFDSLMRAAVNKGSFKLLKELRGLGCQYPFGFYKDAAAKNRINMIRYARLSRHEEGWDWTLFFYTAYKGNLETLKVLLELGCPHVFNRVLGIKDLAPEIEEWIRLECMKKT